MKTANKKETLFSTEVLNEKNPESNGRPRIIRRNALDRRRWRLSMGNPDTGPT